MSVTVSVNGRRHRGLAGGRGARHALFDATGARLRTVPFTPERLKAALA